MKTSDTIKMLVLQSPFHAAVIANMIIGQSEEILKDEQKFIEENKNNIISPELIISVAKECIQRLKDGKP